MGIRTAVVHFQAVVGHVISAIGNRAKTVQAPREQLIDLFGSLTLKTKDIEAFDLSAGSLHNQQRVGKGMITLFHTVISLFGFYSSVSWQQTAGIPSCADLRNRERYRNDPEAASPLPYVPECQAENG